MLKVIFLLRFFLRLMFFRCGLVRLKTGLVKCRHKIFFAMPGGKNWHKMAKMAFNGLKWPKMAYNGQKYE